MAGDYIPKPDEKFHDWAANFMTVLAPKVATWNIPSADYEALEALYGTWGAARTAFLAANHGKIDTLTKNEARKALEGRVRSFAKSWLLYNPKLTDADKESLGLHLPDTIRTRSEPPATRPEPDVAYAPAQLIVHFRDEGSEKRGKPKGVHCLEMKWDFCEEVTQITEVKQLGRSDVATASPLKITCLQGERSRQIVFFLRWEGPTGLKGPWSGPFTAIFP